MLYERTLCYLRHLTGTAKLRPYLRNSVPQFVSEVKDTKKMGPDAEEALKKAIGEVKASM